MTRGYPVFVNLLTMMTTATESPVKLTAGAIAEVKRLMAAPDFNNEELLRIGVKGGGCSGLSYVLGFDKKEEDDQLYDIEGIPVLMKPAHGIYLFGIQVHFENGLNARGFTFNNPNASSTCGCGSSFSV
jgi:iron-sulfur cluster assembly protein